MEFIGEVGGNAKLMDGRDRAKLFFALGDGGAQKAAIFWHIWRGANAFRSWILRGCVQTGELTFRLAWCTTESIVELLSRAGCRDPA